MKAKELIEKLSEFPDAEIVIQERTRSGFWYFDIYKITPEFHTNELLIEIQV